MCKSSRTSAQSKTTSAIRQRPLASSRARTPSSRPMAAAGRSLRSKVVGLIFAPSLLAIAQVLDPPEARFTQWLASLLLGALNIEQTKFLNWQDMAQLLGSVVRFPPSPAPGIGTAGDAGELSRAGLLQCFNARCLGAGEQRDFYFDPHTKQTPTRRMLEGWCRSADKGDARRLYHFIHTAAFRTDKLCVKILARFFSRFCSIVWYDGSNKAPRTGKTGH
jgi:hypothetical protein